MNADTLFSAALKEFYSETQNNSIKIKGRSMEPALKNDESAQVCQASDPLLKPGRCFLFRFKGKLFIHRMVRLFEHYSIFMGDNSIYCEIVPRSQIIGIVRPNKALYWKELYISFINFVFYPMLIIHKRSLRIKKIRVKLITFLKGKK